MSLEQELRRALERTSAPAGFAERVATAAGRQQTPTRTDGRRTHGRLAYGALAATLMLSTIGSAGYLRWTHQRDGERARAQLMTALRVSSTQLARIGQRLALPAQDASDERTTTGERE